jgi:hypothetical protein
MHALQAVCWELQGLAFLLGVYGDGMRRGIQGEGQRRTYIAMMREL